MSDDPFERWHTHGGDVQEGNREPHRHQHGDLGPHVHRPGDTIYFEDGSRAYDPAVIAKIRKDV